MKILSPRNHKDYYDYLTGIYGVDEKVVYDRRQSTLLSTLNIPVINYCPIKQDAPKIAERSWELVGKKHKWVIKYVVTQIFHCMLEVGLKWYMFDVERYLDESKNVCIEWKNTKMVRIKKSQRLSIAPMTFFKSYGIRYQGIWDRRHPGYNPTIIVEEKDAVINPILKDTPITSLIPPPDIYNELSDYLSSLNDVEIIDTRTDIQKAESAGFDRKTSFRNIQ